MATWVVLAALNWSGPRSGVVGFSTGVHPWTYLLNQTLVITHYLRLAAWPRSLVVFYGWPVPLTLGDVLPYALVIVGLLLVTTVAWIRRPAVAFAGVWFFITLAPTSSVLPISTEVGAERRMYVPLMAVAVLTVVGVFWLWNLIASRWPQRTRVWAGGALLALRHPLIGRRLLLMVPTMLVVSVIVFTLVQLPPGDFAEIRVKRLEMEGTAASEELAAHVRRRVT
jgi:hypothetical protein